MKVATSATTHLQSKKINKRPQLALDVAFKTGSSGSSTVTVTEKSHGRSASGTVRFRNVVSFDGITKSVMENSSGFTIASVVDTNNYTITVSDTATVGLIKGGGKIASAGPVTLEA